MAFVFGSSWRTDDTERLAYKELETKSLRTLVFRPSNWSAEQRNPCIVWFFGGAWRVGSPYQFSNQAKHFANLGFVSICPNYRVQSRDNSTPFESTEDAVSAIKWVRKNASKLGVDPSRIAAAGGSSGGQLAAACALMDGSQPLTGEEHYSGVPDALILYNPVLNFDIPKVREIATLEDQSRLVAISPYHQLNSPPPPTIIFHGTSDRIVPFDSIEEFAAKASEFSPTAVIIVPYPNRAHDFFNHGRPDYEAVLEKTEDFLQSLGWVEDGGSL